MTKFHPFENILIKIDTSGHLKRDGISVDIIPDVRPKDTGSHTPESGRFRNRQQSPPEAVTETAGDRRRTDDGQEIN